MRIALCSALWQRHTLAPIWWAGVERIRHRFASHGITLSVTVAGSEPEHEALARQHGATWVRIPNRPLGRKWNAAVERACHDGADFIFILGSDDFLSDALVDRYATLLAEGWLYVGLSGIYFYEPATARLALFNLCGAQYGSPLGAGRLVYTSLLERMRWRPWLDVLNRGLDHDMRSRCELPDGKLIRMGPTLAAVDVKTDTNIWTFDRLAERYCTLEQVRHPKLCIPEWDALMRLGTRTRVAAA